MTNTISLTEVGSQFYIYDSSGVGPSLKYGGADVVAGQFGQWTPIAAAPTATGYEVAWKVPGADQYTVWATDSSGNYISDIGVVSGSSSILQSLETSFQQDLNGDGSIGAPGALAPTVIEASGSTKLDQLGNNYFLDPVSGGTGPALSYGGSPVVAGQFGQWAPVGAEQTASGYKVVLKLAGADQYTVWTTDSSGNYVSDTGVVSGSSSVLQSLEASFQQDLNGDGAISPPSATVIEAFGSTSLVQNGSNYFLDPNGGSPVELSYGGSPVVAGQFGQWAPIGAEQTASGYKVVLKLAGADQYTVWTTDSSGHYVSDTGVVSGSSSVLQSLETGFQQDLNGDGVISPPPATVVIEAFGSTSLVQNGSNYFLDPNGGSPVELSYGGSPVVAGQFGQWAPVGAEQTASGYKVVLELTGADQYTVWTTDSSGHYVSDTGVVSGSSSVLQSLETSFQQDLNGDGVISPPPATVVIEAFGSTSLVQYGSNYFLDPNGGSPVELSYGGSPVVAGSQFGQWTPFAAEQTATGYEVALKVPGADQYTVWTTDSSGNYISGTGVMSGSSSVLQSLETSFQQDLNGDGAIGAPPPTVIEAFGSTSLVQNGGNYFLDPNGGSPVELSYAGSPVVAGQFGQWAPIAAEQTATGYEVAWKVPGADQAAVWYTDSNGNYLSSAVNVASGASAALQPFEPSFQQDLNGDGVISAETGPQFVYEGLDASGAQLYSVQWDILGSHPFEVRVLAPSHPSSNYEHNFLFALPVEGGLAQQTFGSGLNELQKLDVEDQYNATIIEPIFPIGSWYADSSTDPTMNFETFTATLLTKWVDSQFATTGTEKNLLIGFSKSGYGALDLMLKHSSVFDGVAAFDFPADMTAYDSFGGSSIGNYGTDANFQANYRMTAAFIDAWKAQLTTNDHILISEGPAYGSQVADFDRLLTSDGIQHTLLTQTSDAHSWSGGWLSDAVAGLYGLETDLHQTVIEASGSTSLLQDGSNYFLDPNGGLPVELSYGGSPVVAGQSGQLTPIAAEQTATGFEVALATGTDQAAVWYTDSSGNYLSNALNVASGASAALQPFEASFQQDLNHDGYVGLVLNGSAGGQTLTAGSSPTTLIGGPNDTLVGGAAADTFVFLPNFGVNTLNNFKEGTDTLQFSQSMFANAAAVLSNAHQVGSDVAITYDSADVVTLHNTQLASLHTSDFHIV